uniref:4Fe-4S ferredoxin-type domain-containing protein n=1 Tax=Trichuris muris TaxID=70415 RepID=A0A5S6QDN2_TRIMR
MDSSIFFYMGIALLSIWITIVVVLLRKYWFMWKCDDCFCCICYRKCPFCPRKKSAGEGQVLTELRQAFTLGRLSWLHRILTGHSNVIFPQQLITGSVVPITAA